MTDKTLLRMRCECTCVRRGQLEVGRDWNRQKQTERRKMPKVTNRQRPIEGRLFQPERPSPLLKLNFLYIHYAFFAGSENDFWNRVRNVWESIHFHHAIVLNILQISFLVSFHHRYECTIYQQIISHFHSPILMPCSLNIKVWWNMSPG